MRQSWAGNSETGLKISIDGYKIRYSVFNIITPPLTIYGELNGVVTDTTAEFPSVNVYQAEIEHFVNCVKNNSQPITTPEEIITVIKIIQNIYKSAETGKPVEL